uniref:Fe-containing alcohol dehydrogenase-like C-terminal domain-containing protein n=1 Tax=Alloyangia mangrovi TaxID=1779329 RepID=A0A2A3JR29_9RHOB
MLWTAHQTGFHLAPGQRIGLLGGSFDPPHAETHAILLPHSAGFNAAAAAGQLAGAAALFGGDLGGGLWDFAAGLGAPLALAEIGFAETDIAARSRLPSPNPMRIHAPSLLRRCTPCCAVPKRACGPAPADP